MSKGNELIDVDPLNPNSPPLYGNYETTWHKLKLCVPGFPLHSLGDFIFIGNNDLTNGKIDIPQLAVYVKKASLINWCENILTKDKKRFYVPPIVELMFRELNKGKKNIDFIKLNRELGLVKLNKQLGEPYPQIRTNECTGKVYTETVGSIKKFFYSKYGWLHQSELARKSLVIRTEIFLDFFNKGEVVMLYQKDGEPAYIEEIDYFGMGSQFGRLCGGGGILFFFNGVLLHNMLTWKS